MGSIKIQLNIVSILQTDIGKGDSIRVDAKSKVNAAIADYKNALTVYNSIAPLAQKYIDMAVALGEKQIESQLRKAVKDSQDMVKLCNSNIQKLQSI